jgi:hypothetical protein
LFLPASINVIMSFVVDTTEDTGLSSRYATMDCLLTPVRAIRRKHVGITMKIDLPREYVLHMIEQ